MVVIREQTNKCFRPLDGANFFRFEAKWLEEDDCENIVKRVRNSSGVEIGGCLMDGLRKVASVLKGWDSIVLGNLQKRIREKNQELENIRRSEINPSTVNREHVTKDKLNKLENQLDIFWKQRAHVKWLHSGDRNTTYFHSFASERKRKKVEKSQKEN